MKTFRFNSDNDYAYVNTAEKPGNIQIKYDTEGIAVDIFDAMGECQATTFCLYSDLEHVED